MDRSIVISPIALKFHFYFMLLTSTVELLSKSIKRLIDKQLSDSIETCPQENFWIIGVA